MKSRTKRFLEYESIEENQMFFAFLIIFQYQQEDFSHPKIISAVLSNFLSRYLSSEKYFRYFLILNLISQITHWENPVPGLENVQWSFIFKEMFSNFCAQQDARSSGRKKLWRKALIVLLLTLGESNFFKGTGPEKRVLIRIIFLDSTT